MIYIASPYTHPDESVRIARYELVRNFTIHLMNRNFIVFSPIVYGHELAKTGNLPTDFRYWQRFNDYMIDVSVAVCVLCIDGWDESAGVQHEIFYAQRIGRNILFHDPHTFDVRSEYDPQAVAAPKPSGDVCLDCGGMLVRTGSCQTCQSCGTTTGCS